MTVSEKSEKLAEVDTLVQWMKSGMDGPFPQDCSELWLQICRSAAKPARLGEPERSAEFWTDLREQLVNCVPDRKLRAALQVIGDQFARRYAATCGPVEGGRRVCGWLVTQIVALRGA